MAPGLTELKPNEQNLPCTLYEEVVEYADGTDESRWICEVFGADSYYAGSSAYYSTVVVDGIEHIKSQNPNLESGKTTLMANGAGLHNHHLTVGASNALTFGET